MLFGEGESTMINHLKREFEALLARISSLEKENQELRRETAHLSSQVNKPFKSHHVERNTMLGKQKLENSTELKSKETALEPANKQEMKTQSSCQLQQKPGTSNKLPAGPAPPPPPPPLSKTGGAKALRRVPELIEFYRSLVKRDAQKERSNAVVSCSAALNPKNMIGEIENRSSHLLAIKTDVETHGEFIEGLSREVDAAAFTEISEVESFVKWLDGELTCLVDERAVLKHFPKWPERKEDALREAACTYRELKNLESEILSFKDNPKQQILQSLRKIQTLQDRLERSVGNVERVREGTSKRYKELQIPWAWMLESGFVGQLKLSSLGLAKQYMGKITNELKCREPPQRGDLILHGVRFAYRVHQFAGGFNTETVKAFEGLKSISINHESR
ncbi:hypothetical protein DM860_012471 [Cuscuta australis]|uniref:Protein CHUP1, chloroplastic n=1 Tax=Cuscuta australis TaxID=267555 RepID=A0A328DDL7_9ASTE|nr:hypothetical protein DM860_012471 [Cuscuta australis]